jgi:15-cis-phytoene synthase
MNLPEITFLPPQRLALAYAKQDLRRGFGLLLALDDRLELIFRKAGEPLIAQMRLAWWNDVISKPLHERPVGEPLLAILATVEEDNPTLNIATAMLKLVEAWDLLLAHSLWSPEALHEYAAARSSAIFGWYTVSVGSSENDNALLHQMGIDWALYDLLGRCRNEDEFHIIKAAQVVAPQYRRVPRRLRSLSIIAHSASHLAGSSRWSGARLIWHALTGR